MEFQRTSRLNEVFKEEIANIIEAKLKDPRVGFITVTAAEVSADLRHASVYVSIMGSDEEKKASFKGLNTAKGFMRSELGKRLRIKYVPEITFIIDDSVDESLRISKLIDKIHKKEESNSA